MDEMDTFVKKQERTVAWTAFSRREKRLVAFETGVGPAAARSIYRKPKALRPKLSPIYTDANSGYRVALSQTEAKEPHTMTKRETHLIKRSDNRLRDHLARFNRKTKRFSKTPEMLRITLDLFIHRHLVLGNAL
jgi:IS1 family transposase